MKILKYNLPKTLVYLRHFVKTFPFSLFTGNTGNAKDVTNGSIQHASRFGKLYFAVLVSTKSWTTDYEYRCIISGW